MKKYILSIFLILICYFGFGQWPITQNLGSGNTLVQVPANGGLRANLINRSYADTTSANLGYSDSYPGSLIFTTDIQAMWLRNAAADGWIQIMPSGGTGGQRPWLISGNSGLFTSPVDPQYVGTLTNQPFGVLSNGVARLTWNTSGAFGIGSGLSYGNSGEVLTSAGSGAPPTWAAAAASGWALTGNSGTTAGTNFVGTTDNVDLVFKTAGSEIARFSGADYSVQFGYLTTASGEISTAMGGETIASGLRSTAMGDFTTASGIRSTAMGSGTIASGLRSTAMGDNTVASGINSTAMGSGPTASGDRSTAMGNSTVASGEQSTAMGHESIASGLRSTAMGENTVSKSFGGTVIGTFNDSTDATDPIAYNATNRVFQIGVGTADNARSNAMTVLFNGQTTLDKYGVGTFTGTPTYTLQVDASGNIIEGSTGGGTSWNAITDPTGAQALTFGAGENSVWTDQNTTSDNLTINSSTGTTNSLISLNRTGTALAAGNNILELVSSGANGTNAITATGLSVSVTNTNATSGTNIGAAFTASGATTANYSAQFTGAIVPGANDGSAIGTTTRQWSDLFLAEGGVINWDNGDATLTQTGNELRLVGAGYYITGAGGVSTGLTVEGTTASSYAPIDFRTNAGLMGQFLATGTTFSSGAVAGNELCLAGEGSATNVHLLTIGATGNIKFTTGGNTTANERARITAQGNLLIGGTTDPTTAVASLGIYNGTAPTASITNGTILYSEDVAASSELKVRDEAGNITVLSPHNFSQLGAPSEELAWSYYSEKDGKYITVDMAKAIRTIEDLSERVSALEKQLNIKAKPPVKLLYKGKVKKK